MATRFTAAGVGHHEALRVVADRMAGHHHGCLRHRPRYGEQCAWDARTRAAA